MGQRSGLSTVSLTVDPSRNPTIDAPTSWGCTWPNFCTLSDGTLTMGSPFQNYYIAAGVTSWKIPTSGNSVLRVLDGGHQGRPDALLLARFGLIGVAYLAGRSRSSGSYESVRRERVLL